MRFTDADLDALEKEWVEVAKLSTESRVSITFPLAGCPKKHSQRLRLEFGENREIHCGGRGCQLTWMRHNLLRRLVASRTGVIHVPDLCDFDETLQLAPLWTGKIPEVESLRNFASRINRDLAEYGIPWFVSYSKELCRFILRFLPDSQAERKKYRLGLPQKIFFPNSFPPRNTVFPVVRSPGEPLLLHPPPQGHITLE